ncbi:YopX family protein [Streptococcus suis]|uniref:YopX family protein n=1 Tax=Streptococcus suis TaxID=1307 RepID=UPI001F055164|nr:YopX family protein [Streptococcus suis]MCH1645066.1 YopX family protein [Streptococcus suis]
MTPKFRVWDTVKKSMSEVQAIVYAEEKIYPIYSKVIRRYIPFNEAILMQSTGLFDVNGKEIFEGDVIRVNYTDDDSPWTDAIIWSPKDCAWYLKSNKELLGFAMDEPDIIVEVIGNIYENPELVEEK